MHRQVWFPVITFAVLLGGASPCLAQRLFYNRVPYGPAYRPGLSPYLNMLRGGDPAANYYLGVLPEINRRQNAVQFGSALRELEDDLAAPAPADEEGLLPQFSQTGHPTAFNNLGGYFGNSGPRLPRTNPGVAPLGTRRGGGR